MPSAFSAAGTNAAWWRHPAVGLGLGAVFAALITLGLHALSRALDPNIRPFTIFYLAAVAGVAGVWGLRTGLITALFSVLAAALFLIGPRLFLPEWRLRNTIELVGLGIGSTAVALIAGRLHDVLASLREAVAARRAVEARHETFFHDVVAAVTHGRLLIVGREEMKREIAASAPETQADPFRRTNALPITGTDDGGKIRRAARQAARELGFSEERAAALELCIGEAVTNAWKHGGGGYVRILPSAPEGASEGPGLRVLVADEGPGMSTILLPHLALWRGYSTQKSMGMGFSMMLDLADRVLLCTDAAGTLVLIEMSGKSAPDESDIDAFLAGFPEL